MIAKMTRRSLEAWLREQTGGDWIWCGETRGFGARRSVHGGAATFIVQYRVGRGRLAPKRRVTLGTFPTMALDDARELAAEHIRAGWKGIDLVEQRRAAQASKTRQGTVATLAPSFLDGRRAQLRPSSMRPYESIWNRFILPNLGSKAAADVRRLEVAALMDKIEASNGSSAADALYHQLSLFFEWYAARNDDFVSPLIKSMKRHRRGAGARAMTDEELQAFWDACGRAGFAGHAGKFCLLTATRRNEALRAEPHEFSDGDWCIAANRYKTKREHRVPLSRAAAAILEQLPANPAYVFSAGQSPPHYSTAWQTIVDAGFPRHPGLSWHSLRKTARTLMSRAGVRSEHAERALGHVQGAVERAYDLHSYMPEKRAAFEALAAEVERIVSGKAPGNVVQMAGRLPQVA